MAEGRLRAQDPVLPLTSRGRNREATVQSGLIWIRTGMRWAGSTQLSNKGNSGCGKRCYVLDRLEEQRLCLGKQIGAKFRREYLANLFRQSEQPMQGEMANVHLRN